MAAIGDLVIRFNAVTAGLERGVRFARSGMTQLGSAALAANSQLGITAKLSRAVGVAAAFASTSMARLGQVMGLATAGAFRLAKGLWSVVLAARGVVASFAPIGGAIAFGLLLRSGERFARGMQNSLAIMSNVSMQTRKVMEETAQAVAKTTIFSGTQATESYFFLASAGLDAAQSIAALPQVALFAQAGMFDMALATDLATDAQSALGLTVSDANKNLENLTRVTDVLVKANTLANASVEQFSEALTNKAGAALRIVGKDIEEGGSVLAAFADQGVKGAEAGNALNIVLRELQTKAIKFAGAFENAKISVFDASGEMRNMADIVGDLERKLEGMSDEMKKTTLLNLGFSDKSVSFIQALIGMSDKIREYEEGLRMASGTTKLVAEKQMTPFQKGWEKLAATFEEVGTKIMKWLGPGMGQAMTWISDKWIFFEATVVSVWNIIAAGATEMAGLLMDVFGLALDFITSSFPSLVTTFNDVFSKFIDTLDVALGSVEGWSMTLEHLWDVGALAFEELWIRAISAVKGAFFTFADVVTKVFSKLVTKITSTIVGLAALIKKFGGPDLTKGLKLLIESVTAPLTGAPAIIKGIRDQEAKETEKQLDDINRRAFILQQDFLKKQGKLPKLSDRFKITPTELEEISRPGVPKLPKPKEFGEAAQPEGEAPGFAAALVRGSAEAFSAILAATRGPGVMDQVKANTKQTADNTGKLVTAADVAARAGETVPVVDIPI